MKRSKEPTQLAEWTDPLGPPDDLTLPRLPGGVTSRVESEPDGYTTDVSDYLGISDAAQRIGIKRTQLWRIATGETKRMPRIQSYRFYNNGRVEHKFKPSDVEAYRRWYQGEYKARSRRKRAASALTDFAWLLQQAAGVRLDLAPTTEKEPVKKGNSTSRGVARLRSGLPTLEELANL